MREIWNVRLEVETEEANSLASVIYDLKERLGPNFKVRSASFIWREGLVSYPGLVPVPEPTNEA